MESLNEASVEPEVKSEEVKLPPPVAGFDVFKAQQKEKLETDVVYNIVKKVREFEIQLLE
jgi:hypothetical protein